MKKTKKKDDKMHKFMNKYLDKFDKLIVQAQKEKDKEDFDFSIHALTAAIMRQIVMNNVCTIILLTRSEKLCKSFLMMKLIIDILKQKKSVKGLDLTNEKRKTITFKPKNITQKQWVNLLLELNLMSKAWKPYGVDITIQAPGIKKTLLWGTKVGAQISDQDR